MEKRAFRARELISNILRFVMGVCVRLDCSLPVAFANHISRCLPLGEHRAQGQWPRLNLKRRGEGRGVGSAKLLACAPSAGCCERFLRSGKSWRLYVPLRPLLALAEFDERIHSSAKSTEQRRKRFLLLPIVVFPTWIWLLVRWFVRSHSREESSAGERQLFLMRFERKGLAQLTSLEGFTLNQYDRRLQ